MHYVKGMNADIFRLFLANNTLLKMELLYLMANPLFQEEDRDMQVSIMESKILEFMEWHDLTKDQLSDVYHSLRGQDDLTEQ